MDRDSPSAHLNLGVALKLKGAAGRGRAAALEKARSWTRRAPTGAEAERVLAPSPRTGQRARGEGRPPHSVAARRAGTSRARTGRFR